MKILLLTSTIVNGKQKEKGWEGEVSFSDGTTLVSIGKAEEIKEDEEVSVALEVDVKNSKAFKQMQKDIEHYKEEKAAASLYYSELFKSLRKCTNIQCVKELLDVDDAEPEIMD